MCGVSQTAVFLTNNNTDEFSIIIAYLPQQQKFIKGLPKVVKLNYENTRSEFSAKLLITWVNNLHEGNLNINSTTKSTEKQHQISHSMPYMHEKYLIMHFLFTKDREVDVSNETYFSISIFACGPRFTESVPIVQCTFWCWINVLQTVIKINLVVSNEKS